MQKYSRFYQVYPRFWMWNIVGIILLSIVAINATCFKSDFTLSVEPLVEAHQIKASVRNIQSARLDTGSEMFTFVNVITNIGSEDQVVELVVTFEGDYQKAPRWWFREDEDAHNFLINRQGPAHLLVKKGVEYYIVTDIIFPRNTDASVFLGNIISVTI